MMASKFLGYRRGGCTRTLRSRTHCNHSPALLFVEELEARTVPSASALDFGGGFNGNALTLNGAAHYDGSKLQLTDGNGGETASAFYSTRVHISSFTTDFSFQLSNAAGDGFTFTIQGLAVTALGTNGAGLGYAGIPNSVAVKFDLSDNGGEGIDSTGLYTNGANPTLPAINLANTGIDLHSGDVINVHMTYDGSTLIVTETDPTQQSTATQSVAVNLTSVVGSNLAYVGFTASTSAATANQEILGWSYTETNLKPAIGVNLSNVASYNQDILFADAMKEGGGWGSMNAPWDGTAKVDANGWPLQDAAASVLGINAPGGAPNGTYKVIFTGQAAQITPVACTFTVQKKTYDPATNTTSADLILNNQAPYQTSLFIAFAGTKRNPNDSPGTGLTNLKVMLPVAPGSTTSYDPSVTFTNQIKSLLSTFSTVRYMDYSATNWNQQVNWSDRLLPGGNQYQAAAGYGWEGKGASWEYAVQLANETHTDMWINIPVNASADYIAKLANLLRYGSDGVNPYPSFQANPVYKGLDADLKVYIEYSNEIWNTGFSQSQANSAAAAAEVKAGGSPLNYDDSTDPNVWTRRRVAEKIVQISNQFRNVFGDGQMASRIRPVLEWFHGNTLQTASDALNFLNNYYDNGDGMPHVATPHPVNYYVWGGGSDWYFSVNSESGLGEVTVPDGGFETPVVSGSQTNPTGASWTFTGTAGIVHNGSTLPAAPEGTQAGFIQNTGSFTQTLTFPADKVDISFYAAEGASSKESFDVYLDNTELKSSFFANDFTPSSTNYLGADGKPVVYHTYAVDATAGTHRLKFVGSGTGTVYIDNVQVGGINPMYNSGLNLAAVDSGAGVDAQYAEAFGLHVTSYEGGLDIGGTDYTHVTDLQEQADLDPRAQQAQIAGLNELFKNGSELAMVFHSSGYDPWGLADPNVYAQATPKLQGIAAVLAAPVPAPTIGLALPASVGQSATVNANQSLFPGINAAAVFTLNTVVPGTYSLTLNGSQDNASGKEHIVLDGQWLPGTLSLPQNGVGSSAGLTLVITTPGLHGIALYVEGPQKIFLNSLTVTRTAPTPSLIRLVIFGLPSNTTAGDMGNVTVQATDADGNTAAGYLGTIHFTSSDPKAVFQGDYTFTAADAGTHTFSVVLRMAGIQNLSVTDTLTNKSTGSEGLIRVNPGVASSFVVSGFPSSITAGSPGTLTVTAMDAYGNIASGYLGTVHFMTSDSQVPPSDYTFRSGDNGTQTFPIVLFTAGMQSITVTDTANSAVTGMQTGILIAPAPANHFQVSAPSNAMPGIAFDVTVTATDPYSNVDTNYQGTITFSSSDSDPGVFLPPDYPFQPGDAGVASFPAGVTLITVGSQSLTITDTNTAITGSATISVVPPPGFGKTRSPQPHPPISEVFSLLNLDERANATRVTGGGRTLPGMSIAPVASETIGQRSVSALASPSADGDHREHWAASFTAALPERSLLTARRLTDAVFDQDFEILPEETRTIWR